jgi:hypothetical protein
MNGRFAFWATGFALVALFVLLGFLGQGVESGPAFCLFRRATGIACPGCGLTRAAAALARGDVAGSIGFHPLFALVAAEAGVGWALWGRALYDRGDFPRRAATLVAVATAALFVAVWIARGLAGTLPR